MAPPPPAQPKTGRIAARHRSAAALPVAVIGSLAASLIPSAAHAAPATHAPRPNAAPADPVRALAPAIGAANPAPPPLRYTVVEGDTVSGIASRFGLSTAAVLARNGLSWRSLIFPGQVLDLVPATPPQDAGDSTLRYTIVGGDTISEIAQAHGLRTADVLRANGLDPVSIIYPGQVVVLPQPSAAAVATTAPARFPLDAEMRRNAEVIVAVGRSLGVGDRAILVALVAAAQESGLRNLGYGDRDSLGLFQQRPSTGWGDPARILDPVASTRSFFLGTPAAPGLLDVEGWEALGLGAAAQAVQISAHPEAYSRWESSAMVWLSEIG